MAEESLERKQEQYLNRIQQGYQGLERHTEQYLKDHKKLRLNLAQLIEEARLESDLGLADVGKHLGKSRQAVHKIILEAFGIRNEDKSAAAAKGHQMKKEEPVVRP